jgi:hypothetical protein
VPKRDASNGPGRSPGESRGVGDPQQDLWQTNASEGDGTRTRNRRIDSPVLMSFGHVSTASLLRCKSLIINGFVPFHPTIRLGGVAFTLTNIVAKLLPRHESQIGKWRPRSMGPLPIPGIAICAEVLRTGARKTWRRGGTRFRDYIQVTMVFAGDDRLVHSARTPGGTPVRSATPSGAAPRLHRPVPAIYGPSGDVKWDEADPTYALAGAKRGG